MSIPEIDCRNCKWVSSPQRHEKTNYTLAHTSWICYYYPKEIEVLAVYDVYGERGHFCSKFEVKK